MNSPCNQPEFTLSRRQWLQRSASGFGTLALANMLTNDGFAADEGRRDTKNPFVPRATHFPAKAKHIIYLYMDGAPIG